MGKQFDDLSKALARGVSRRQALQGFVGGVLAAGLAAVIPGRARADAGGGNSACAHFCNYIYGEDTPEAGACTSEAAHGMGACYVYGPQSPACQGVLCPPGSICLSMNMNGYGAPQCVSA